MTSHALDLLAEFVARDDATLSDTARRWVEAAMIDTLGCILAGSRYPVAVNARSAARQLGAGDVSILGTNETAAPAIAGNMTRPMR